MSTPAVVLTDLTQASINGTGVFDTLMRAVREHLENEFKLGRIKGPEYSTVYLGSLDSVLQTSLNFVATSKKIALEADLLAQQVLSLQAEVSLKAKQIELADKELLIAAQKLTLASREADIATAKLANIPKEGALLDAQAALQTQQKINLISEELGIDARTALTTQQAANAVHEGEVLVGQKCKLDAEYDMILGTTLKVAGETSLLAQKTVTERAQTSAVGVDADSVVGKQKALYGAQTEGFARDAEQKAAKLLVDTWSVRRTTDEGTIAGQAKDANGNPIGVDNRLGDADISRVVTKLLQGVGANT